MIKLKRILILALIINLIMVSGNLDLYYADNETANVKDILSSTIIMNLNSSVAFVRNVEVTISTINEKAAPFIENNKIFVPLRFTVESLGGTLEWKATTHETIMKLKGQSITINNQTGLVVNNSASPETLSIKTVDGISYVGLDYLKGILTEKIYTYKSLIIIGMDYDINTDNTSILESIFSKYEINEVGNTSGNGANGGLIAKQGNWIYYSMGILEDSLSKVNLDENDNIKLSGDRCRSINVIDDWIYYTDYIGMEIYKVKIDGTDKTKICNNAGMYINVVGEWVYYSSEADGRKLYKVKIDGTSNTKLNDESVYYINVIDDHIYYYTYSDGEMATYHRLSLDG